MTMTNAVKHERTTEGAETQIARAFVAARLAGRPLHEYPGVVPQDLETAYRCQEAAIGLWPERVAGWKVARIPANQQTHYPAERLIGPAFKGNIRIARTAEPVECPIIDGGFAAVEAELVIRVGVDAPRGKSEWTIDEATPFVGSMHIGIEVASSPLASLNDLGAGAVISDFGNNWGVVVGAEIRNWRALHEIVVLSFIDEEFVGRGVASIRHGALGALAFTLAQCARRGRPLRAGDVITTGMITGVHDVRVGQRSRHVFEDCGEVRSRIVREGGRRS